MSKSRNNITSQVTPASLLAKHSETLTAMAQAVDGMAQANKAIEAGKETMASCRALFERCTKSLRGDKIKVGASRRTCGFAAYFYDQLIGLGIKPNTANNYLTSFRMSVNEGRAFTLNASRDGVAKKKEIIPPAAESTAGSNVKVHTPDTVRMVQEGSDPFTERDSSNGGDVAVPPNTAIHNQISQCIQANRAHLDHLFMLLGNVHMRGNQDAIAAIREELSRIESEVLEAAKR